MYPTGMSGCIFALLRTTVEDTDLYDLDVDWTGALATLNVAHQFYTWTRYVIESGRNDSTHTAWFTYPKDLPDITSWATRANVTTAWKGQQYFLSGKLGALDRWVYFLKDSEVLPCSLQ